jgi:hypothetical protein
VINESVTVSISLNLYQNVTSFPLVEASLSGQELANASRAFEDAIKKLTPRASVLDLAIQLRSGGDWINATGQFKVQGVSSRAGDFVNFNCSWKSFRVQDNLKVGNLSYNLFGEYYLRPIIVDYANATHPGSPLNATLKRVTFYRAPADPIDPASAVSLVGNATLLDFAALTVPISSWKRAYNVSAHRTFWNLDAKPILQFSIRAESANKTYLLTAYHAYNGSILVPGIAFAEGDNVKVDLGSGYRETVMASSLVVSVAVAISLNFYLRSRSRRDKQLSRRM